MCRMLSPRGEEIFHCAQSQGLPLPSEGEDTGEGELRDTFTTDGRKFAYARESPW